MEFLILVSIAAVVVPVMRGFFRRVPVAQRVRVERRVSTQSRAQALRAEREWYNQQSSKGAK